MVFFALLFFLLTFRTVVSNKISVSLRRQTLTWRFGKFATLYRHSPLQSAQYLPRSIGRATRDPSPYIRSADDHTEATIHSHIYQTQLPINQQDSDLFYHYLFTTTISIGTPPQPFLAGVDTSWSDLFVPSVNCTLDSRIRDDCAPRRKYNSTLSSTYTTNMSTVELSYYLLDTRGRVGYDSLHIGRWTVPQQGFEEAPYWSSWYPSWWNPLESVLGLARLPPRKSHSNMKEKNPLRTLIEREMLDRNMFALTLPRSDAEIGELILGGSDERYAKSAISVPITNVLENTPNDVVYFLASCGWQVEVSAISLGSTPDDKPPLHLSLDGWTAIVSNSADYISVPVDIGRQILRHLNMEDGEDIDCGELDYNVPELTVFFGASGAITLNARQYFMEIQDQQKGTRCVLVFSNWYFNGSPDNSKGWIILGSPFLTRLHSVFDLDQNTISFTVRSEP